MASNSLNSLASYCPDCVAVDRTEWACSATAHRIHPTDPESIFVELIEALTESSACASACAAPCELMAGIQVTLLASLPRAELNIDHFSPFYSELGYRVIATYHNFTHLSSIGSEEAGQFGQDVRLPPIFETGDVSLKFS